MGFDVQDVLSTLQGPAINVLIDGYTVRTAKPDDLPICNKLYYETHGHNRQRELEDAIQRGTAAVTEEEGGSIKGVCSMMGYGGFAVAENNEALKALIGHASEFIGPGIIVPSGNGEVMRWCMEHGLQIVQQLTIMTKGFYQPPTTPYIPSILY